MPVDEAAVPRQLEELRRQIRELGPSVAKSFKSTVAKLQAQADDLQAQTEHLAGLITVSSGGATFNTGSVPGDQVFHYFDAPTPLTLTVTAATGHVLITIGCGQATLDPGETSAIASVTVQGSAPSGWQYSITTSVDARLYSTAGRLFGVPLIASVPLDVPNNEPLTFTVKFGVWSASTTNLATAQFDNGYINAQVIDA